MIVKQLKVGLNYALGPGRDDPRMPQVIAGDADGFRRVCAASKSAQRFKHFALSHDVADRPSPDQMVEDIHSFLRQISGGRTPEQLAFVAVLHHEPAGDQIGDPVEARMKRHRYAIHLFVAEVDLVTGKRLQLYYAPAHKTALWAWLKRFNQERGYACPTDPDRRKKNKQKWSQDQINSLARSLVRQTTTAWSTGHRPNASEWAALLKPHALDGRIECRLCSETLLAKIVLPGMASATSLRLQPDGLLEIRAAKSNQVSAKSADADPAPERYADQVITKYRWKKVPRGSRGMEPRSGTDMNRGGMS